MANSNAKTTVIHLFELSLSDLLNASAFCKHNIQVSIKT